MTLINNYLSRNILYPTLAIITILSAIILLTQSIKYIDLMVTHGISGLDFFYLTILLLPSLLFIIIPICVFIAIIYSLNKLTLHREINILKGIGLSNFSIAKPILKIVLSITILHYVIALYWMPVVNHQFKDLISNLKENYITFFLQEKVFAQPTKNLTLYIDSKTGSNKFNHIFYHDTSSEKGSTVTLVAETGELIKKDNKIFLNLKNGNRQDLNKDGELSVLHFENLLILLDFNKHSSKKRGLTLQERHLSELIFHDKNLYPEIKSKMIAEANNRITWPMFDFILTLLAIMALLSGEHNRSGKIKRIIYFSLLAGLIIIINIGLNSLSYNYTSMIFLSYIFIFGTCGLLIYLLFLRQQRS